MAKKVDKWPPQLAADKAFDIADKIYRSFGKSVNVDLLPDILDCRRRSSYFAKRLLAMQAFRLATVGNGVLTLTPLALRIVAPVSEEEGHEAKIESIKSIPLLKEMLERYPGGHLPDEPLLRNLLSREHEVSDKPMGAWLKFVKDSVEASRSRIARIIETPGITAEQAIDEVLKGEPPQSVVHRRTVVGDVENMLKIPLAGERYILIPRDLTEKEASYFATWFEMWKKLHEEQ
ncbi:MAG: hypothetical protein FJ217_07735 [Ignavibacteria bacterium]|nr:hypothetical protein [Ignavibacteria bacterium]